MRADQHRTLSTLESIIRILERMAEPTRTLRENVEVFHLQFLRVLGSGTDRAHYVVKDGCNLRFWFESVRFSEDLDLDVVITAKETLKRKVDRLLAEGPLPALLRSSGLRVLASSAPKQTDPTQRWKILLEASGISTPFHTKIEFSRRSAVGAHAHEYESVTPAVSARYRLPPTLASHYVPSAAIAQKIQALAHRTETQARDVFDLGHLISTRAPILQLDAATRKALPTAIDRALSVSYDDYSAQVTAFLEPAHRELFASREAWDALQSSVIDALQTGGS